MYSITKNGSESNSCYINCVNANIYQAATTFLNRADVTKESKPSICQLQQVSYIRIIRL